MLTYLINVTGDLLAVSIIIGVIFAFIDHFCAERDRHIVRGGLVLGLVAAAVRAYITNTKRLVGDWKVGAYGYGVALAIFILFIVAFVVYSRSLLNSSADTKKGNRAKLVISLFSALLPFFAIIKPLL